MKKIEIALKNLLLNFLLLAKFSKKNKVTDFGDPASKILFVRLNRIGDALVSTPLLHEIRKKVKSKIILLADGKNHFVFKNNPDIDEVVVFQKGLKGFFKVLRMIKRENIETVVDLHVDVSTTVSFLVALCSASNKFGLAKENRKIYTQTAEYLEGSKNHVIDRIMKIGDLFGIRTDEVKASVHFYPGTENYVSAEKFLSEKFKERKFLFGINISAGSGARFWGVENYVRLIEFLAGYDFNLLLLSSPEDFGYAAEISNRKTAVFSSPKYEEFGALISKLDMLFTPDTAAVHLASAFGVPVFGLYVKYNTDDMIWSPYGCKFGCVVTEEPTLKNIKFDEVNKELERFLKSIIC